MSPESRSPRSCRGVSSGPGRRRSVNPAEPAEVFECRGQPLVHVAGLSERFAESLCGFRAPDLGSGARPTRIPLSGTLSEARTLKGSNRSRLPRARTSVRVPGPRGPEVLDLGGWHVITMAVHPRGIKGANGVSLGRAIGVDAGSLGGVKTIARKKDLDGMVHPGPPTRSYLRPASNYREVN